MAQVSFKQIKDAQLATHRFRVAIAPFIEEDAAQLNVWLKMIEERLGRFAEDLLDATKTRTIA